MKWLCQHCELKDGCASRSPKGEGWWAGKDLKVASSFYLNKVFLRIASKPSCLNKVCYAHARIFCIPPTAPKKNLGTSCREPFLVGREGFEPSKAEPTDLQSVPFDRSGISPNNLNFKKYCTHNRVFFRDYQPIRIWQITKANEDYELLR